MASGQRRTVRVKRDGEGAWNEVGKRAAWQRAVATAGALGKPGPSYQEWVARGAWKAEPKAKTVWIRMPIQRAALFRLHGVAGQLGCSWSEIVEEAVDLWLERYTMVLSRAQAEDLTAVDNAKRAERGLEPLIDDWVGIYRLLRVAGAQDRYVRVGGREELLERELQKAQARTARRCPQRGGEETFTVNGEPSPLSPDDEYLWLYRPRCVPGARSWKGRRLFVASRKKR